MRDSWTSFWKGPSKHSCLPALASTDLLPLQRIWITLAKSLPPKCEVLDLGSGDGAVLKILREARRDLRLTGIDAAEIDRAQAKPFHILGGVQMEKLPFAQRRFAAVVSQFGVEYSDMKRTGFEVYRVLQDAGQVRLLIHHRGGPIITHNLARSAALYWAAVESQYVDKAKKLAKARLSVGLASPPLITAAPDEALRRYPAQGVAWEFLTGVVQIMNSGRPPQAQIALLSNLEERALAEIERISDLAQAACDESGIRELVEILNDAGIVVEQPRLVTSEGSQTPIAWEVCGCKGLGSD
jgi:SAM-dependent methyltransferase